MFDIWKYCDTNSYKLRTQCVRICYSAIFFLILSTFFIRDHSSITSSERWVGGVRKCQFLMIYSTVHHQRSGWVGLKKSKTWWRNTWMPPIIWNLHWNFTDVSMLSKEVTSSLSRKYFNKFENFQCPTFWTNIIPSLDVFLHLWHSLNAKSAVHWKLGHCIFASRNMYL